jgi:tryptophanyl-tRNA synthetase
MYAALADIAVEEVCQRYGGRQFSEFKQDFVDLAVAALAPVTAEVARLRRDPGHVDDILRQGAARAKQLAEPILEQVYEAVGFLHG